MNNKEKFYNSIIVKFGFLLHENFSVHAVVLLILNLLSAITVTGIFNLFNYPLINYKITSFILFVIIATLLELVVKTFVMRYFIDIIFKTFGTLTLIIHALLFYLSEVIVNNFTFTNSVILSILIFTVVFLIVRLLLINIYQKYVLKHLIKKEN